MNIFRQDLEQFDQGFPLLLPTPTGGRKKFHAKIQELQTRHECNNQCQTFKEFRTKTIKIIPKREIQFNNFRQRTSEAYYIPINKKITKKNLQHDYILQQRKNYKQLELHQQQRIQSDLLKKIVSSLASKGYIIELIAEIVKRPVSTVRYIINSGSQDTNAQQFIWSQDHNDWVRQILTQENIKYCFSMKNLLKKFNQEFQCKLKRHKFQKMLQIYLKISYKFPSITKEASQKERIKNLRYEFSVKIANYIQEGYEIIFLDETYIGRNLKKLKLWQFKDTPIQIKDFQPDIPLSILGAISTEGFLAYQLVSGPVNGIIYAQHLQQLIQKHQNIYHSQKVLYILDNATIHKSDSSSKIVLSQIEHLFLPPYTPQFNPIETLWAQIKKDLFKQLQSQEKIDVQNRLHKIINKFSTYAIMKLCQSCTKFYLKSYLKESF
ncbi:hypothetical protein pb186bvf_000856 [Paramecium bursaria]